MYAKNVSIDRAIQLAPSLIAAGAHASRSDKYQFISTADILHELNARGFEIASLRTQRVNDKSRLGFERHQLRLRDSARHTVGDVFPEIILTNSHDGTSGFRLESGLFRLACSNGLTVAHGNTAAISVPHRGNDVLERVIEGTFRVIGEAEQGARVAQDWNCIELSPQEQEAFADAALGLRFDIEEGKPAPVSPRQVLMTRRHADAGNSLWKTFNVIQENLVKGGLNARASNGRRLRTREVTGIDSSDKLNRALWTLGERMAQLKGMH